MATSSPARLYKYESFSAQSLHNLKSQSIYFGSPSGFNDPYDCAVFPRLKELRDEDVEYIRRHYLAERDLPPKAQQEFLQTSTDTLRKTLGRIGQNVLDEAVQSFLQKRGVTCFSERNDSLLMWGHYGGRFKGFCLEFRSDCAPLSKARKVVYTDAMPAIDLVPLLCSPMDTDEVLDIYCTKALDWQYEREWRCLHDKAGTVYTYPAEALTGIYIGPDASFATLEIIALIIAGQNPGVQLWQGTRSKSCFTVDFSPVTYVSHIEAKRQEQARAAESGTNLDATT